MAVEFMDHAAAAFVAREKGWFAEAGLDVTAYESYATGMALAAALARGDIDAAFICLVPAVNS
ncbi:MAG: ABC transporter substrate-binding protein, partial [Thermodesulfobacteriota bacterium]|nr:ABC transporter substrate-binding protein [Thermodesulfobacteriota bacterium]